MITLNFRGISETLNTLKNVQKQVNYASSKALNNLAKNVQRMEITDELPHSLKLRSQWFKPGTKYGVNIKFSSKTNLVAVVGSQANWLNLVERGGSKKPTGNRKALAIPTSNVTTDKIRPKGEKPARILKQPRAFTATMPSGKAGIFIRVGDDRYPIKAMYFFKNSSTVDKQLHFTESGMVLVNNTYLIEFTKQLQQAILDSK